MLGNGFSNVVRYLLSHIPELHTEPSKEAEILAMIANAGFAGQSTHCLYCGCSQHQACPGGCDWAAFRVCTTRSCVRAWRKDPEAYAEKIAATL